MIQNGVPIWPIFNQSQCPICEKPAELVATIRCRDVLDYGLPIWGRAGHRWQICRAGCWVHILVETEAGEMVNRALFMELGSLPPVDYSSTGDIELKPKRTTPPTLPGINMGSFEKKRQIGIKLDTFKTR